MRSNFGTVGKLLLTLEKSNIPSKCKMNLHRVDIHNTYTSFLIKKIKCNSIGRTFAFILLLLGGATFAQGEYTVYKYDNGRISSEGTMVDGKPEGYWKTYFPSGNIQSEGNRKNFELDSTWIFYNDSQEKVSEITYKRGKKNGVQITYRDGVPYEKTFYANDKRTDEVLNYYPTGELRSRIPIEEGKEHGDGFEYSRDGRIITLLGYKEGNLRKADKVNRYDNEGKKRGPWIGFHPNGVLASEGYYMNDKKNGIFKTFDKKGDLLTLEKYRDGELVVDSEESVILDLRNTYHEDGTLKSTGGYVDGIKEGTHRLYDRDGNLEGGELYSKGEKIGEGIIDDTGAYQGYWKLYYPTGELQAEGEYEDTKRIGDWIFYHKNGQIEHKAKYINGLPQGKWTWYYDNGKLRREEFYRRGREDGTVTEYDLEGNIVVQGEYVSGLRDGEWFLNVGDHTEKGKYSDGERTGEWIYEYEDGQINFIGEYVAGMAVGKHKWYHPNGQVMLEGRYNSGVRTGSWKKYDEEGAEILNVKYKSGREVKINGKRVIRAEQYDIDS